MTASTSHRTVAFDALLSSGLVLLATATQGQDANWDLRNYHLYTPMALLNGRWPRDIAVAQLQSWHNPTLDLPLGGLVLAGAPGWLVSLWLALPAAVALFFALRLMDRLWPDAASRWRSATAALVAITGAATMPEVATSFNDAFVAALALPALWWVSGAQQRNDAWRGWWLPGLLLGVAAGLKLTAAMYCLGLFAACLCAGPLRQAAGRVAMLALGGIGGFLASAGWWLWRIWQEHGNPLFPYFNQWFRSPDALYHGHTDDRFKPDSLLDALLVPLRLLRDNQLYSEPVLADPRLLLGLLALLAWAILYWRKRRADTGPAPWPLLAFVAASYGAWLALYGIYRYLLPLEMLLSVAFIGMLSQLPLRRWARPTLALTAVLVIAATNRPGWGRDDFHAPMIDVRFPALPRDALVLLAGDYPLGYAVAFLPTEVPAISLANNFMAPERCTRLQDRVESRVREHRGPLYLLRETPKPDKPAPAFAAYDLAIASDCAAVAGGLAPIELCPLQRGARVSARYCSWTAAGQ